jgi:iron complex transport system substrate-binding protein
VRIVSLLPSTTEILFAVGAGPEVVGVTFECDFPPEARTRRVVSTTTLPAGLTAAQIDTEVRARLARGEDLYHLDRGALRDLRPDLVVTQDLCAVCAVEVAEVDQALAYLGCQAAVVNVDPMTLDAVLDSILVLGQATGHQAQADLLLAGLRSRLERVAVAVAGRARPRVAVLEWTDPLFSAGHWIPDMIAAAGAESVLGEAGTRSQRIEGAALAAADPEIVVVAPCGYRLETSVQLAGELIAAGKLPPRGQVWAVDADAAFVRPGPRVVDGIEALAGVAHPGVVAPRPELATCVRAE